MISWIRGPMALDTLGEIVSPAHTAIVVIDMQNDDCKPEGKWARLGDTSMVDDMVPRLRHLIAVARTLGVSIIWLKNVWRKGQGFKSISPAYLRFLFFKCHFGLEDRPVEEGAWGSEIIEELDVQTEDVVVQKTRSSGFLGTELDLILRSNNIKTLVITGAATQACVQSTVFDALCYDYYVVVVRDCVAAFRQDLHGAALTIFESLTDVCSAHEVMDHWNVSPSFVNESGSGPS